MKLQVSNSNEPQWRNITVKSELPGKLKKLNELSRNLWWAWNSEGKTLFHDLDRDTWRATSENPVKMLQRLTNEKIEAIQNDSAMMARIEHTYDMYQEYMKKPLRTDIPSVAYFCMEYGLCNALKIYSGGLGILAGDYVKEASDRCVNMTAVGFLYRYGYFTQTLSMDGQQVANYEAQNFHQLPIEPVLDDNGNQLVHEVPYPGRTIYANVWKANVGRVTLYLLDTDLDLNSEYDREITHKLYGGDWENRIKQEYLLGIGGVLLLKRLGIKADIYHCNEGHAALLNLQRLVDMVQEDGLGFNEALEVVRATSLYTVHTPVPAGHDYFDEELFGKYMGGYPDRLGITWQELMDMGRDNPGSDERFCMSTFALNTTQESNGVSWLHGEVSKRMFAPLWKGYAPEESHVGYVTNGVHMPTWAASEWKAFYKQVLGDDFMEKQELESTWAPLMNVPDEKIWEMRMMLKQKFIRFVKRDFRDNWLKNQGDPTRITSIVEKINPDALLIGFARRFATYKRAHLLFTDLERLNKIVNNPEHPVIFLENYDMTLSKRLITGVDVWLNTPTRPLEASGTSGEKAEMNGLLNFSVLDGWWYEGYREGAGWALTSKRTYTDQAQQDKLDSATIYSMLENEIIPLYFAKNSKGYSPEWVQYIKNSICHIAPNYTMSRMMRDYFDKFYCPQAQRAQRLVADDYALARQIVAWKERVAAHWDDVHLVGNIMGNREAIASGKADIDVTMRLDTATLGDDVRLELVVYRDEDGHTSFYRAEPLNVVARDGDIFTYNCKVPFHENGMFRYAYRAYPWCDLLPHRQDFAYLKWL